MKPSRNSIASACSTRLSFSLVIVVPRGMREERQAAAGLSQFESPYSFASVRDLGLRKGPLPKGAEDPPLARGKKTGSIVARSSSWFRPPHWQVEDLSRKRPNSW